MQCVPHKLGLVKKKKKTKQNDFESMNNGDKQDDIKFNVFFCFFFLLLAIILMNFCNNYVEPSKVKYFIYKDRHSFVYTSMI